MGAVVTVMNMKGGVGKTTVAMHLGGLLGRYDIGEKRRKVLLVDYDPQFNLSQAFIPAKRYFGLESAGKTTLAILQDDETDLDPFVLQVPTDEVPPKPRTLIHKLHRSQNGSALDIIPSTLDLMYIALGQSTRRVAPIETRFKSFLDECRKSYDVVFIDCHPAGSILTKTSLQNSDHVLIPVVPQKYAIRGIGLMMKFIETGRLGGALPKAHVLFNLAQRTGRSPQELAIRRNPKIGPKCLKTTLKYFRAFSDPVDGEGFVWYSRKPWSTQAFQNLLAVAYEFVSLTGI